MPTEFYRQKNDKTGVSDFYESGTNRYIGPTEFGTGANFVETTAPSTRVQNINVPEVPSTVDAGLVNAGMSVGDTSIPEPKSPAIQSLISNNAINQSNQEQGLTNYYSERLGTLQKDIQSSKDEIDKLQKERDTKVTGEYDKLTTPFREETEKKYNEKFKVESMIQTRIDLTDDLIKYGGLLQDELVAETERPGLKSSSERRQASIKDTYQSKIATAQAAMASISQNISLVQTYIDRSVNAIVADRNDRINYLNFVNDIYNTKISDEKDTILTLKKDEKDAIQSIISQTEKEIEQIDINKQTIVDLMSDPDTAVAVHKAGVLLTDTPEQMATKLSKFYADNPEYMYSDDLLSPSEAKTLGVAYGTTKRQAAKMGITPQYVGSGEDIGDRTGISFNTDDYGRLLAVGLQKSRVDYILDGLNSGTSLDEIAKAEGLSDTQVTALKNVLSGVTSTQEQNQKAVQDDVDFYVSMIFSENGSFFDGETGEIKWSAVPQALRTATQKAYNQKIKEAQEAQGNKPQKSGNWFTNLVRSISEAKPSNVVQNLFR